jgi:hypothetical protein
MKIAPIGSHVEVLNVTINDQLFEVVKGVYYGPINRGSEKGKHWVSVCTVRLAIETDRIRRLGTKEELGYE